MPFLLLLHPRVATNADTATVYIDLLPGTIEETTQFSDSALVYLDLQPSAIYLQVTCLLEIVGDMRRWVIEAPLARWTIGEPVARVHILDVFKRWVILEMRRFRWKL
jgi:hypothetical protein